MKKKEIEKLANVLYNKMRSFDKTREDVPYDPDNGYYRSDFDEEVSNRFIKLVNNILKYPENLLIEKSDKQIVISTSDIKDLKKKPVRNNGQVKLKSLSEENYLRIEIFKEIGFNVTHGYNKISRYQDQNIYDKVIDSVRSCIKLQNSQNFNNMWEDISKESGILRDSNLDDILT